jgi:hypothetical protein
MLNEEKDTENLKTTESPKVEVKELTPFMPKKTFILIGLLTLATIILLIIALYPSVSGSLKALNNNQNKTPKVVVNIPQTELTIAMPTLLPATDTAGNIYGADVLLSTQRSKIDVIDLELTFDPKSIENVNITPSDFFTEPVILTKKIDTVKGKISFVFGIGPGQKPVSKQGVVAVITFTPIAAKGWTIIDFAENNKVISEEKVQSILTSTKGLQFPYGMTP